MEEIDSRTAMAEYCFLGLRTMEGISAVDFEDRFKASFDDRYGDVREELVDDGLLADDGEGRIRLTDKGIELSNQVFERFLK